VGIWASDPVTELKNFRFDTIGEEVVGNSSLRRATPFEKALVNAEDDFETAESSLRIMV